MIHDTFDSPIGPLLLSSDEQGLREILLPAHQDPSSPPPRPRAGAGELDPVKSQLAEYFAGRLRSFDLPLAPRGTEFQRRVWQALLEIPYGETWSYGRLADRVGRPGAARAVGAANGANPIPIVIPCHRVIGSNGKLTGYGGGIPAKRALLELERLARWNG